MHVCMCVYSVTRAAAAPPELLGVLRSVDTPVERTGDDMSTTGGSPGYDPADIHPPFRHHTARCDREGTPWGRKIRVIATKNHLRPQSTGPMYLYYRDSFNGEKS